MTEISTSILNMMKGKETETIFALEQAKTDYFHIDVMDGKFVEKNTYSYMLETASYIRRISSIFLMVSRMLMRPLLALTKYGVYNSGPT